VESFLLCFWLLVDQNRDVERMFEFYIAADAILRDEDRRWYGFEVAEVIEEGELVFEGMADPPPLHLFALGALHHLIATAQVLVSFRVVENGTSMNASVCTFGATATLHAAATN
jgi:hypothetical protein